VTSPTKAKEKIVKRLHVHVAVESIEESVKFYSVLFGGEPTVRKDDYAKWMLEDPRVNFAISARGRVPGVAHLGIQVEANEELAEVTSRLRSAEQRLFDEGATTCCYAKSEKAWVVDPSGVSWETFLTTGASTTYGESRPRADVSSPSACCTSTSSGSASCG
jgi:catechol 2,3-dioxygenase-like lactoylglutathione lyase family enzyme